MGIVEDLSADLEALLRAGRVEFPEKAAGTGEVAGLLATETWRLNQQSALAGDPEVLRDALRFCGDIHEGLRKLVESLNYCSEGLIQMVNNYRGTDEEAGAAFNLISRELTEGPPPEPASVPPNIGDPERPGSASGSYPPYWIESTPQPDDPDDTLAEHDDELEAQPETEFPEVPS
jgi:hypothetical protein